MARPSKYGAIPAVVNGRRFSSQKEAREYSKLLALERGGIIRDLQCQVAFPLVINGVLVCKYVADFVWKEVSTGVVVVADAKGMRTPVYQLKKKLMLAVLGITILEL